jgi:hypothetical protein
MGQFFLVANEEMFLILPELKSGSCTVFSGF